MFVELPWKGAWKRVHVQGISQLLAEAYYDCIHVIYVREIWRIQAWIWGLRVFQSQFLLSSVLGQVYKCWIANLYLLFVLFDFDNCQKC